MDTFVVGNPTSNGVHVICADGESKFWLDPAIELARSFGMSD